jgi:hypothetical protein
MGNVKENQKGFFKEIVHFIFLNLSKNIHTQNRSEIFPSRM